MTTIRAFIKKHPLLSFYALAFAIIWGGLIMVVGGPSEIPGSPEKFETRFGLVLLAWLAGPSVAGILMTGLLYGRAGLREFRSRLLRWRVGARWYAVALLTAPLLSVATLFALSLTSSEYLPTILTTSDKGALLLLGIVGTFVGGIFEELGWTGFAIPTLQKQGHSVLSTGLIVGSLWGVWHFLVNVLASNSMSGELSVAIYLPAMLFAVLAWLTAFRMLM